MADNNPTAVANELIDAFSAGDWARFRATTRPGRGLRGDRDRAAH